MHRNFVAGPRSRTLVRASQVCHPKAAAARAVPSARSESEEVQYLRDELARLQRELVDLRAATSTFVRGLM
jgi:hypothetical protein